MGWLSNMLGLGMSKGKSWAGGLVLIGLGAYMIASGDIEKGVGLIGSGVAAWGIADKLEKASK